MGPFLKLISLFTPDGQRRLIPIMIGILFASILEMAGIGSLGPFMAVVSDPSVIQGQPILTHVYQTFGFQSDRTFLIFLGIVVFSLTLISTLFRMVVSYVMYRFTGNCRHSLGLRLFKQYLYQPYYFFLNHNSGELSAKLLNEVDMAAGMVLGPAMDICIRGILILAILIFLIIINPAIAAISFGIFGLLYVILFGFVKSRLTRYGKELGDSNLLRHKTTAEAFGGIKDIKILEKESFFINSYSVEAKRFASTQAAYQMLSMIPGQAMQSLAVGFAIAMIVVLLGISGSLAAIFPMLAIYAFAIIRLMPNVQCCFSNAASLRYYSYIINSLYTDMVTLSSPPDDQAMNVMPEILPFSHQIALKGIEFSYPDSHEPVLKGIDLLIAKNMTIGLVGTTGCGKTTLVDAIMGLLEPTTGSIVVDTIPVITTPVDTGKKETIASWKRNFGYVPQYIYLRDDTITANIAFGIPEGMQDKDAVKRAAQIANIHEFIMTELPKGYNTIVGERGVRLSGGQRQRIGIARSLYHDPEILVMDEATSALDSITEEAVMDAIHKLKHLKTIIIIAHRLSTVRECDMICFMEKGRIIARGCYEELLKKNEQFRTMAKVVVK